jgi:bifunctional aspartokinase / homoserine dehydrogenase 1
VSSTLAMKFGGTSVGTIAALSQVLSIVMHEATQRDHLLLIVSALEGVTDQLIEAAQLAQLSQRRGYRRIVATLRTRHLALIEHLPLGTRERSTLQADIDRLLFDMLDVCQALSDKPETMNFPAAADRIVGVGERLAARIIAALLRQNNLRGVAIDATDLLVTDDVFGNATPDLELTRQRINQNLLPMLQRKIIPVVTGFIGATANGRPTTLGRGGSDYTASIIAVCADVDEVWIWTDVDGIMSTDPREVPEARVIPELSYEEVAELAYFGARILHSKMVGPLQQGRIPLRIKNVFKPQQRGTLIHDVPVGQARAIKAVTSIPGISLSAQGSGPLSAISKLVDDTLFSATGNRAEVMISSQSSARSFICFVIPTTAGPDALHTTQLALEDQLRVHPDTLAWTVAPTMVITAIAARLDELPSLVAQVLSALDGIRILATAQGPSHCSFSVVIEPRSADDALRAIHALTLNPR